MKAYEVDLLVEQDILNFAILPPPHCWRRRRLIFKSEEYSPDTLHDHYYFDFNGRLEITQNVVHALITGQGLLSIATSGNDTPLDFINLVSIRKTGVTVGGCSEGDNYRVFCDRGFKYHEEL
jgi:hypothetical protein